MPVVLPRETNEYLSTTVTAADDPTGDDVAFAFLPSGTRPSSGDWRAGEWAPGAPPYVARIRVGGTGSGATVELAPGSYKAWLRITDSPEVPVHQFDTVKVQ